MTVMSILGIIIAIALLLLFIWLLMQPKQGARASNAPSPAIPDASPSRGQRDIDTPPVVDALPQNRSSLSGLPAALEAEVYQLLNSGQKISAIKRVREAQGWGLKEAKDCVEALERYELPPIPDPHITADPTPELRQAVLRLLAAHRKVSAVKLVREVTRWRLIQAKKYVDDLEAEVKFEEF